MTDKKERNKETVLPEKDVCTLSFLLNQLILQDHLGSMERESIYIISVFRCLIAERKEKSFLMLRN